MRWSMKHMMKHAVVRFKPKLDFPCIFNWSNYVFEFTFSLKIHKHLFLVWFYCTISFLFISRKKKRQTRKKNKKVIIFLSLSLFYPIYIIHFYVIFKIARGTLVTIQLKTTLNDKERGTKMYIPLHSIVTRSLYVHCVSLILNGAHPNSLSLMKWLKQTAWVL